MPALQYFLKIIPTVILAFILFKIISFQTSSELSSFSSQKIQHSKKCRNEFQLFSDLKLNAVRGDLIECQRYYGVYDHWMVYVGNLQVIHLRETSEIRYEPLKKVMKGGKCRVNNLLLPGLERGFLLRDTEIIAKTAEEYFFAFQKNQYPIDFQYDLKTFNCESFVTLCAFGTNFSQQIETISSKSSIDSFVNCVNKATGRMS